MVSSRTIIVLIGILGALANCNEHVPSSGTEIIIAKHENSEEKPTDYAPLLHQGLSPFISNFIQKGTNVFFKPHFVLSSGHVPLPGQTVIVRNDDPILPEPAPVIIEKPPAPVMIPEAPVLPPLTLPVPPAVIDCEEVVKPYPLPVVSIEEQPPPLVIPEAPVLPPLSLPALPLPVVNDCEETVVVSNTPEVLPSLSLPNPPLPVVIEEQVECDDGVVNISQPLVMPTASVVEMPMPAMFFPTLFQTHYTPTPQVSVVREKIERVEKIIMPSFPVIDPIISFPAECVQNIITERVLPNILSQQKIQVVPALPPYPVPSPYLPTFINML